MLKSLTDKIMVGIINGFSMFRNATQCRSCSLSFALRVNYCYHHKLFLIINNGCFVTYFRDNLIRLFWLRLFLLSACMLFVCVLHWSVGIILPIFALFCVLLGLFVVNLSLAIRLWLMAWQGSARDLFVHLVLDSIGLALLLFLTDGARNPFVSFFLLPLMIAAATLPARYSWSLAGLTALVYSGLFVFYHPLVMIGQNPSDFFWIHQVGMWLNFVLTAILIAYFVTRMGAGLRLRDTQLHRLREESLRQEQMVALGTFAAGAAHELGSPLATIAVLSHDLEKSYAHDRELSADLKVIGEQVQIGKALLAQLLARAIAQDAQPLPINDFLKSVFDKWLLQHPSLHADIDCLDALTAVVPIDPALSQALLNLLHNAAQASLAVSAHARVKVTVTYRESLLFLCVLDEGEGIDPAVLLTLGHGIVPSNKVDGLGLGVLLAHSTITRLGGKVHLFNRSDGVCGVRTEIFLPMMAVGQEHV